MENQDKKRLLIINAALLRFAHYGLAKTTMTDIAKDISFSKALLYYYFPDKLSLYVSVMEQLMQTISKDILKSVEKTSTCTEGVLMVLQKRQGYIQKYYNLMEFNKIISRELPDDLYDKFSRARAFEIKIISGLIHRGVEKGEFQVDNIELTTEILVEALAGLHFNVLNRDKNICPTQEQFKQIFVKEKILARIFLAGLASDSKS